jgi:ribosomal protein S18 acetylase RimI-like enzyme
VLQRECRDLPAVYRLPGALMIADHCGQPVGCVGLAPYPDERTAEIKRLYVRPAWRRNGIARTLMNHAHHHAAQHGITRLILDVLPSRTAVISFYHRLGYTETGLFATESPTPMVYMQRPVTQGPGKVIPGGLSERCPGLRAGAAGGFGRWLTRSGS